jgi:thioredoxin-like negative regulator of GroEL
VPVVLAEERGVVIDFWGTWCQSGRALRPHLEQLSNDHAGRWHFVAVHTDVHLDVATKYGVMSTPTNGSRPLRTRRALVCVTAK